MVKRVFKDNDLKIEVCNRLWTFNPLTVKLIAAAIDNSVSTYQNVDSFLKGFEINNNNYY